MNGITGEVAVSKNNFNQLQKKIKDVPDFKKEIEDALKKRTSELLEVVLTGATILNASDIHIEPQKEQARTRIRIDGILQDVIALNSQTYSNLLSRIKMLSGIKLNITDKAQDGRFSITIDKTSIEVRASTLPSEYGESIVLRILNPKNLMDLEKLGLRDDLLVVFNKEIKKPNGMIVVTGPTGSGKTTTLYAFLKKIQKPEIKIITIEDPIEYQLDGVSQTQVDEKKGYNFASGLRSIVRQDPDVILVGEIRDLETAQIALQASLTGHLVFSTLHTNDAAGTIPRLTSLGAKPVNIGPALNMVVAQRLVRRVCKHCSGQRKPTPEELVQIRNAAKAVNKKIDENITIPVVKGCKQCNNTGYKGRVAIFEAFTSNDEIESLILKNPSIPEIKKLALKQGMVPMFQDGILKVLQGVTTIEEVKRVAEEN